MIEDSILDSVKKLLSGIPAENADFDKDIIYAINSWFTTLMQLGVGPENGFGITGKNETWGQFSQDPVVIRWASEYIATKTRITFDPPQSSSALECLKELASEYEWRIYIYAEFGN